MWEQSQVSLSPLFVVEEGGSFVVMGLPDPLGRHHAECHLGL
jgi:hypothetical protein